MWDRIELDERHRAELAQRGLALPAYRRDGLRTRIVHIGVGGFHRAHLAVACHRLATETGSDWGICGVGLLPGDSVMADALRAQHHLYSLTLKSGSDRETDVIGSIIDYIFAPDQSSAVVDRIAAPDTAIVSMTVTESGYDDTERNRRAFDVIAAGLDARRIAGRSGITILSCDNLPGNGDAARRCVDAAARRRGVDGWVAEYCSFPNSMVDRITPATTDADRAHLLERYGVVDRWPVVAEPFWQWVMEDDFAAGRPDFESVGAVYTDNVHAWELYKLRLLNAGHSAIAYLAALAGITYVDEALALPDFREFLNQFLMLEAAPTVTPIDGQPREEYAAMVVDRFANSGVRDQIARLCVDGSSKIPKFLLPTIDAQVRQGGPIARSALVLAGWAHYLAQVPEAEQAPDAFGDQARMFARRAVIDPVEFLDTRLGFSPDIAADRRFVRAFVDAHRSIGAVGVSDSVRAIVGQ